MFRLLLIALLFLTSPATASTQDDDLNTYTWLAVNLSFDYPTDWVLRDDLTTSGTVSLSTSFEAMDATPIPDGEILMQIVPPISTHPDNLVRLGVLNLTPEVVLNQLQQIARMIPERNEIDGREVYTLTTKANGMTFLMIALHYDDDMIALTYAVTAGDSIDDYYDQVMAVALSIGWGELPEPNLEVQSVQAPPTGEFQGVEWVFQSELETYAPDFVGGTFGRMDRSDEALFVATGVNQLLVFTFDGVLDRIITNDLIYFDDVAVDSDGTLWVLDRKNLKIWHITPSGELLGALGGYGEGVMQFNIYGAADIALDDDYIYVLTTKPYQSYMVEDVQVWRRDGEFVSLLISLPRDGGVRDSTLLYVNDEHIYITVGGDYLYSIYDKAGNLERHIPALLQTSYPGEFTFNEEDNLLFFETFGTIYRYSPDSEGIELFGFSATERTGEIPSGELFYPRGLSVLPDGDLVVVDANETHFQVMRVSMGD